MKPVNKRPFHLSIIFFFISSMTIWFMPLASRDGISALLYVLASIFWMFIILGFLVMRPVSRRRKNDKKYRQKARIPLLQFFSNKPALIFDALLIVGLIVILLSFLIRTLPEWVTLPAVFLFVFSLEMHGLFNSRNYEYMSVVNNRNFRVF